MRMVCGVWRVSSTNFARSRHGVTGRTANARVAKVPPARCRYTPNAASDLAPAQERQSLEQVDVLLVLQKRAVQRRDQLAGIAFPQHFRRDVLVEQQFQPVQKLRGRRLLLQPRHLAYLE